MLQHVRFLVRPGSAINVLDYTHLDVVLLHRESANKNRTGTESGSFGPSSVSYGGKLVGNRAPD